MRLSRELARQEGIFTGISGGATFAGALEVCQSAPEGATVLCMLPDTGERYLSTPLFDGISADMSDEEREIFESTEACRVGAAAPAAPNAEDVGVTPWADEFVDGVLASRELPVV